MFKGVHDGLREKLRKVLSAKGGEKKRVERRIRLQLEELETRALLSASSVTPEPAVTTASASETVQTNLTVAPSSTTSFSGYTPTQLQRAYGVPSSINGKPAGTGETIAIVDAYNDPNIANDLKYFSSQEGLPAANLTVLNQSGSTANLPTANASWAVEESLDVEWAHAMAPGANIVLVEANSNSLSDLMSAVKTAASYSNVGVVSMSWGGSEFSGETSYDSYFQPRSTSNPNGYTNPNVTFVASAGDSSAYMGPEWPASSPDVLAVGGTTLQLTNTNAISSQTAWSASFSWSYGLEGGGGGVSSYESTPSFQTSNGVNYGGRTSPDVSFDANPSTGVKVYDTYGEPGWGYVGGTSVGAPSWAGIVADADQQSVANGHGNLSTATVEGALYTVYNTSGGAKYTNSSAYSSNFDDITSGSNGYSATTGYDLATGLGAPKVSAIVALLGSNPATSPPASPTPAVVSGTTTGTTSSTSNAPGGGHTHRYDVAVVTDGPSASGDAGAGVVLAAATNTPISVSVATPAVSPANAGTNAPASVNLAFSSALESSPTMLASNGIVSGDPSGAPAPQGATVFGATGWNGASSSMRLSSFGLNGPLVDRVSGALAGDSSRDEDSSSDQTPSAISDFAGGEDAALEASAPEAAEGGAGDGGAGDE